MRRQGRRSGPAATRRHGQRALRRFRPLTPMASPRALCDMCRLSVVEPFLLTLVDDRVGVGREILTMTTMSIDTCASGVQPRQRAYRPLNQYLRAPCTNSCRPFALRLQFGAYQAVALSVRDDLLINVCPLFRPTSLSSSRSLRSIHPTANPNSFLTPHFLVE